MGKKNQNPKLKKGKQPAIKKVGKKTEKLAEVSFEEHLLEYPTNENIDGASLLCYSIGESAQVNLIDYNKY